MNKFVFRSLRLQKQISTEFLFPSAEEVLLRVLMKQSRRNLMNSALADLGNYVKSFIFRRLVSDSTRWLQLKSAGEGGGGWKLLSSFSDVSPRFVDSRAHSWLHWMRLRRSPWIISCFRLREIFQLFTSTCCRALEIWRLKHSSIWVAWRREWGDVRVLRPSNREFNYVFWPFRTFESEAELDRVSSIVLTSCAGTTYYARREFFVPKLQ